MLQQAWALSRDPTATTPLKEICSVDAPVLELCGAVLHFEDFMILEREIFTSMRNHHLWARTSRVDDPLQFTVPEELRQYVNSRAALVNMGAAIAAGKPQDQWRMYLPVAAHTSWCSYLTVRDLCKFSKYFEYASEFTDENLQDRFEDVGLELLRILHEMLPEACVTALFKSLSLDKYLYEGFITQNYVAPVQLGNYTLVQARVPLALRAQIVRHRPLQFVDDFWHLLGNPSVLEMDLHEQITMELVAPTSFWQTIMSKRACWIAQADLWAPITSQFGPGTLPCADGHCPYPTDNELRRQGKDPNVICPIYCRLHSIDKVPWLPAMQAELTHRAPFWKGYVSE
jgi:hypothetical protein